MNTAYSAQVKAWNDHALKKGLSRTYLQLPSLLFVRIGHEPPPLIFWKFWQIAAMLGFNFGFLWGNMMHLMTWKRDGTPAAMQFAISIVAGVFFGVWMAYGFKRKLKQSGLTTWEDFTASLKDTPSQQAG